MGIMDKFKNFIGIPEDEYYDDDDVEFIRNESPRAEAFNNETAPIHSEGKRGNKVVNIHATTQLQVVLVKPERFDDASSVADHLNSKRTVVLNLESTNKDVSRRLIDFCLVLPMRTMDRSNGSQTAPISSHLIMSTSWVTCLMN